MVPKAFLASILCQIESTGNFVGTKLQVVRFFLVMEERRPSSDKSEHVRLLRARAEELRDAAEHMKFREGKSALIILAQSYDRMADELDRPVAMGLQKPVQHRN
jgi:hypothetical protein